MYSYEFRNLKNPQSITRLAIKSQESSTLCIHDLQRRYCRKKLNDREERKKIKPVVNYMSKLTAVNPLPPLANSAVATAGI